MKAYAEKVKKYYKYQDVAWVQPVLSSAGTLGGNSFAVYATSTWAGYSVVNAVDANAGSYWLSEFQSGAPFTFYNPVPIKVTKIVVSRQHTDTGIQAYTGKVEASNDNNIWEEVGSFTGGTWNGGFTVDMSSNTGYYKYYKITPTSASNNTWGIANLTITADQREVVDGTESDYDYYIEIPLCKLPSKVDRKYYKYVDTKQPNAQIIGTLTNNEGIVSGFNTSNYLILPNSFDVSGNKIWELVTKVTTGSTIEEYASIFASINDGADALWLETRSSKHWGLALTSGSGWTIANHAVGSYTVQPNTSYWLKLSFNGNAYILSYSLDGVDYVTDITINSSTSIRTLPLAVGIVKGGDAWKCSWNGSIDLNKSYIKINDELWWIGTVIETQQSSQSDYDFYKDVEIYYGIGD